MPESLFPEPRAKGLASSSTPGARQRRSRARSHSARTAHPRPYVNATTARGRLDLDGCLLGFRWELVAEDFVEKAVHDWMQAVVADLLDG